MKLSAPKKVTFYVAVALFVIAILATLIQLPPLTTYRGWIMALSFLVLAAGVVLPDL